MKHITRCLLFLVFACSASIAFGQDATNEDFGIFWKKFKTDSTFQKSRIQFPLKYNGHVAGEESKTPIKKSDWRYKDNEFWLDYKLINTSKPEKGDQAATQERKLSYAPKDEGFANAFHFKLIDGKWFLVKVEEWGC